MQILVPQRDVLSTDKEQYAVREEKFRDIWAPARLMVCYSVNLDYLILQMKE